MITCESCKYVRPDQSASEWRWTAYTCINKNSDYYGSLLNITTSGTKLNWISWTGCKHGEQLEIRGLETRKTPKPRVSIKSLGVDLVSSI